MPDCLLSRAVEVAKLRGKIKPMIDKHVTIVGADVVSALQAELAKVRQ